MLPPMTHPPTTTTARCSDLRGVPGRWSLTLERHPPVTSLAPSTSTNTRQRIPDEHVDNARAAKTGADEYHADAAEREPQVRLLLGQR